MNRYQFEVLAFLEKNGKNVYAIRTLSDKLKISGTEVSKALDELTNIGAILRNENLLEITDKGLDMLEPYRVKRAAYIKQLFYKYFNLKCTLSTFRDYRYSACDIIIRLLQTACSFSIYRISFSTFRTAYMTL